MKYIITIITFCFFIPTLASAEEYFSTKLCESGQYNCIQVKPGETWSQLFKDSHQRNLIKRFNRMNTPLLENMYVAIPENLENMTLMDLSPFPFTISPPGSKLLVVDLSLLAWGAYDSAGNLLKWGPASGGRRWCYDTNARGKTPTGRFQIYDIRDENCVSTKYPLEKGGGAPMPYALFFKGGYAIHGSEEVPGYNASHGCIRVFKQDAQWLNEKFAKSEGVTKILMLPYEE